MPLAASGLTSARFTFHTDERVFSAKNILGDGAGGRIFTQYKMAFGRDVDAAINISKWSNKK